MPGLGVSESRRALAWGLIMLATVGVLAWRLPSVHVETSVFALAPENLGDRGLVEAAKALREEAQKRIAFLVGHADAQLAAAAADNLAEGLRGLPGMVEIRARIPEGGPGAFLRFYAPHQALLLLPEDQTRLEQGPAALAEAALRNLYLPPGMSGSLGFQQDLFGQAGRWLAARAGATGALREHDGRLGVQGEGKQWVLVSAELRVRPEGLRASSAFEQGLDAARRRALGHSGVDVIRTGFSFHELAAARHAQQEAGSIGTVSALALFAMLWLAFRRWRAIGLLFIPVLAGCLMGTAAVLLTGAPLYLITLVFGSTLVGVGEDYGLHLLSGLYKDQPWDPRARLRLVSRSLWLALLTSLLGYGMLFLVPIAAVRQVALFSCVGLFGAWLTTLWLFPWATVGLPLAPVRARRSMVRIAFLWPRMGRRGLWALLPVFGALVWSWGSLKTEDDVRLLYAQEPALHAEQRRAEALLRLPGDSRYFAISGTDAEARLQAEETLRARLSALEPGLAPALGVSLFVPSQAAQARARDAWGQALPAAAKRLQAELQEPGLARRLQVQVQAQSHPLSVETWLTDPVSTPFRRLWREGDGAVAVLLLPSGTQLDAAALAAEAAAVPGVRFVDPLGEMSVQMSRLRRQLSWVLLLGGLVVIAALYWALGRAATGALAPTLLGVGFGVAGLTWAGLPLNAFAVLAVALIMGMGVDYGVFVQECEPGGESAALMAISVGAASNLAAFGLLAFSSTPALKTLGLVLSLGLGVAWLTALSFSRFQRSKVHA